MKTALDYRNVLIPDTTLFNVSWWIYFVFVLLATILALVIVIGTVVFFAKSSEDSLCSCSAIATFTILILHFAILSCLRWFALMWKDTGCMIALIVLNVISILFQCAMIRFSSGDHSGPEPMTVPHIVMLIFTYIFEVVILALLLSEILNMNK